MEIEILILTFKQINPWKWQKPKNSHFKRIIFVLTDVNIMFCTLNCTSLPLFLTLCPPLYQEQKSPVWPAKNLGIGWSEKDTPDPLQILEKEGCIWRNLRIWTACVALLWRIIDVTISETPWILEKSSVLWYEFLEKWKRDSQNCIYIPKRMYLFSVGYLSHTF